MPHSDVATVLRPAVSARAPRSLSRPRNGRLLVVSNRVMAPGSVQTGGLAHALADVLSTVGGTWLGWSGKLSRHSGHHRHREGAVDFVTWNIPRSDFEGYYHQFANRTLWPLLHGRLDLMAFSRQSLATYCAVNSEFANRIVAEAGDAGAIWIHDYHLLPLATMLRARGVDCPIGLFLHTPFPEPSIAASLPGHAQLFAHLLAYDLIGVQTRRDESALRAYLGEHHGSRIGGTLGAVARGGRTCRVQAFPIGIDCEAMAAHVRSSLHSEAVLELGRSIEGRELLIGVDRLDYSKGIPQRLQAFGHMLETHPELRGKATCLQIAPESRRDLSEYRQLSREVQQLVGSINGRYADPAWTPIRYINQSFPHDVLAGLYALSKVGLVTPLRDGMNLVAKEFLACQPAEDPGVLVLSEFAGAAEELADAALLVNPHDVESTASSMAAALVMPRAERIHRRKTAMRTLERNDIHSWASTFLESLQKAKRPEISPVHN